MYGVCGCDTPQLITPHDGHPTLDRAIEASKRATLESLEDAAKSMQLKEKEKAREKRRTEDQILDNREVRVGGREGERERGREGVRDGGREGRLEGVQDGGREGGSALTLLLIFSSPFRGSACGEKPVSCVRRRGVTVRWSVRMTWSSL